MPCVTDMKTSMGKTDLSGRERYDGCKDKAGESLETCAKAALERGGRYFQFGRFPANNFQSNFWSDDALGGVAFCEVKKTTAEPCDCSVSCDLQDDDQNDLY